jgi:hypothetical protein
VRREDAGEGLLCQELRGKQKTRIESVSSSEFIHYETSERQTYNIVIIVASCNLLRAGGTPIASPITFSPSDVSVGSSLGANL